MEKWSMFGDEVQQAASAHALAEWPKESVGIVVAGSYQPLVNIAEEPEKDFKFDKTVMLTDGLQSVIHSHPSGLYDPSILDMEQQDAMALPWGIIACNEGVTLPIFWFGPGVPIPPLRGRPYRFGPSGSDGKGDCYAVIKDWFELERGIKLREVPRDAPLCRAETPWYDSLFLDYGWQEIASTDVDVGDVVLCRIIQKVTNHGMLYVGNGLALHHQENQLSAEVPVGPWLRFRTRCIRYVGST